MPEPGATNRVMTRTGKIRLVLVALPLVLIATGGVIVGVVGETNADARHPILPADSSPSPAATLSDPEICAHVITLTPCPVYLQGIGPSERQVLQGKALEAIATPESTPGTPPSPGATLSLAPVEPMITPSLGAQTPDADNKFDNPRPHQYVATGQWIGLRSDGSYEKLTVGVAGAGERPIMDVNIYDSQDNELKTLLAVPLAVQGAPSISQSPDAGPVHVTGATGGAVAWDINSLSFI